MSDKEKKKDGSKAITYLRRAGYVAASITAIGILVFSIDGRYQTAAAADSATQVQMRVDYAQNVKREEGDIRTQINLIYLELQFIEASGQAQAARKTLLTQQLTVLLSRLTELQQ